jgi:hypothetical protein
MHNASAPVAIAKSMLPLLQCHTNMNTSALLQALSHLLRHSENVEHVFHCVVSLLSRADISTTAQPTQTKKVPGIDGSGVYAFALSTLIVAYNMHVEPYSAKDNTHTNSEFDQMCIQAGQCMERLYQHMPPSVDAPHFVCNPTDTAVLLLALRGISSTLGRQSINYIDPDRGQLQLRKAMGWMAQSIQIYMSFESTLTLWTLNAAKILLDRVDLAQCGDNRAILAAVRTPKYEAQWTVALQDMHMFAMVHCDIQSRAHALDKHNLDALFATLLCKHTTSLDFWSHIIFWENDRLPQWCNPLTLEYKQQHSDDVQALRMAPMHPLQQHGHPSRCVIIRRADHWIVQTLQTYELCPTLVCAVLSWLTYTQQTSSKELLLVGIDDSVQALAQMLL